MFNQIISHINFRGKGRIISLIQKIFFPQDKIYKIKDFPAAKARFQLNPIWAHESYLIFFGCPKDILDDFAFIKENWPGSGNIIDVGANIGLYSLYFYYDLLTPNDKIYGFEPIQEIYARGIKNILLNKAEQNIQLESLAISDQSGSAPIFIYKDIYNVSGNSSLVNQINANAKIKLIIPVSTIDDYCGKNNIKNVQLMKIDVEGNELAALRGAREIIKRDSPTIFFEVNEESFAKGFNEASAIIKQFFEPLKYRIYFQDGRTKVPVEEAIKTNRIKNGNWWAEKI